MRKTTVVLIVIIALALAVRLYNLGDAHPLNQDEAIGGYDAYSMLLTGADSWGDHWPVLFREYGMFVNQFQVYLTMPAVALFGLNEFAVRFPWALLGGLTAVAAFIIGRELADETTGLVAAALAAFSPYLLLAHQMALPSNLIHFPVAAGVAFLVVGLRKPKYWLASALCFGLAANVYATSLAFTIVFLAGALLLNWKYFLANRRHALAAAALLLVLVLPLAWAHFSQPATNAYYPIVSVFNPDAPTNPLHLQFPASVFSNFASYASPNLLFCEPGSAPYSCLAPLWLAPFFLIGLIAMALSFRRDRRVALLVWWLVAAGIAMSFFFPAGNARRFSFALPAIECIAAIGIGALAVLAAKEKQLLKRAALACILVLAAVAFVWTSYSAVNFVYSIYPVDYAYLHQPGVKQAVLYAESHTEFDRIYISSGVNQAYIYALFYAKYDPVAFQSQQYGKFVRPGSWTGVTRVGGRYEVCKPAECPAASNPLFIVGSNDADGLRVIERVSADGRPTGLVLATR